MLVGSSFGSDMVMVSRRFWLRILTSCVTLGRLPASRSFNFSIVKRKFLTQLNWILAQGEGELRGRGWVASFHKVRGLKELITGCGGSSPP